MSAAAAPALSREVEFLDERLEARIGAQPSSIGSTNSKRSPGSRIVSANG
jgi:hypothetical protein